MEAHDESLSSSSVGSSGTTASINETQLPTYENNTNNHTEDSPVKDEEHDNKRNSTTNIMEIQTKEDKSIGIDNPGFDDDDDEVKKVLQETPKSSKNANGKSNNGVFLNSPPSVDTSMLTEVNLSQTSDVIKDKSMAEAVNLELVNMTPYKGSEKDGVNGIPVKKESEGEGGAGNYHDAYDEYFVPVNEHRKYMRGEKLYVTKDKRRPRSRKKCICWGIGFVILAVGILIAILAGTGVILSQDENMVLNESSSRQFGNNDVKSAGFGNIPGKRPVDVTSSTPSPPSSTVPALPPTTDMTQLYVPRVVEGELVIDSMEFDPLLADRESPEFKALAAALEQEIKNALFDQSTLNYGSSDIFVKVMDFSSGSVVVKYRVGWMFKEGIRNPPNPIDKDALRERLEMHIKRYAGFLDTYHLTTGSVRASNVINSCQFNNGDCSHECVFDYSSQLNFMCKCPTELTLDASGKKCVDSAGHEPSAEPTSEPEPKSEPEPSSEEPKAEPEPTSEEPKSEPEPTSEEPKSEPEPSSEEPKSEPEPTSEEPKSEPEPSSEEPKSEPEPTSEEPKSEPEPSSEEPKSEPEPTSEEPKSEPEPTSEEPKSEPISEEPKSEPEPSSEEPKSEPEPTSEEPKSEPEPSSEEPKSEPEPNAEPHPITEVPSAEPSSSPSSHADDSSTETMHDFNAVHAHKDNMQQEGDHRDVAMTTNKPEVTKTSHDDHPDHHDHHDHHDSHEHTDSNEHHYIDVHGDNTDQRENNEHHTEMPSAEETEHKDDKHTFIGVVPLNTETTTTKKHDEAGMNDMEHATTKKNVIVGMTDMPMEQTTTYPEHMPGHVILEADFEDEKYHSDSTERNNVMSSETTMVSTKEEEHGGSMLLGHKGEHHTTMTPEDKKNKTIVDFVKEFGIVEKAVKNKSHVEYGEDPRLELATNGPVISMDGDFWDNVHQGGVHIPRENVSEAMNNGTAKGIKEEMVMTTTKPDVTKDEKDRKEEMSENKAKNPYWFDNNLFPESDNDTALNSLSPDDYDNHDHSYKQHKNDTSKLSLKKRPRLDKDEMHVKNSNEDKKAVTASYEFIPPTVGPLLTRNETNSEPNSILMENEEKNNQTDRIINLENGFSNDLNHILMNNGSSESSRQFSGGDKLGAELEMTTEANVDEMSSTSYSGISGNVPSSTDTISNTDRDISDGIGESTDRVAAMDKSEEVANTESNTNPAVMSESSTEMNKASHEMMDEDNMSTKMMDLPPTLATLYNKQSTTEEKTMTTESEDKVEMTTMPEEHMMSSFDDSDKKESVMTMESVQTPRGVIDLLDSESSSTNVLGGSTVSVPIQDSKIEESSTKSAEKAAEPESMTTISNEDEDTDEMIMNPAWLKVKSTTENNTEAIEDENRLANDLHSFVALAENNSDANKTDAEGIKSQSVEANKGTIDVEGNSSATESIVYISDSDHKDTSTKPPAHHDDNVFGDSLVNDYTEEDVENKLLYASKLKTSTENNIESSSSVTTQSSIVKADEGSTEKMEKMEKDLSVVPLKTEAKKSNKKQSKFGDNTQEKSVDKQQKYDKESAQKSDRLGFAAGFDYNSDPYNMFDDYENLDLNKDTENPMKTMNTTPIPDNVPEITTIFTEKTSEEISSTATPKEVTKGTDNLNKLTGSEKSDKKDEDIVNPLADGLEPAHDVSTKKIEAEVTTTTEGSSTSVVSVEKVTMSSSSEESSSMSSEVTTVLPTSESSSSASTEKSEVETTSRIVTLPLGGFPSPQQFSKCSTGQFQCVNGTSRDGSYCVSGATKCDSVNDCTDGSDELGCIEQGCPGNFQCASGQCLKRHLVCNDIVDCNDASDELACEKWQCQVDEFQCPSGRCIPVTWQCDGKPDCSNHTDEYNCQTKCGASEFLCPEGWCIPMTWRCNGVPECATGEDEKQCDCSPDQFKCNTGGCVSKEATCNGKEDCPDASDEWDCLRLRNDSMQLEIRTASDTWSAVCQDNWSSLWSDAACQNLGYSKAIFTEYKPNASPRQMYALKDDALANRDSLRLPASLANATECKADAYVEISCQDFTCGSHSLAGGVAARLVGGDGATNGQWPSVALLYHTKHKLSCTASIISPKWLLSSYNCLHLRDKNLGAHSWVVFAGGSMFDTEKPETQIKEIRSIVPYPQVKYNRFQYNNDIALVELTSPMVFNRYVGAICLPDKEIEPRQLCVTAGWGYTSPGEINFSQYLHYLPVPTIDLKECNSTKHYAGFITGDEICAGFTDAEKSPCYNDEGAPLMCVNEGGVWELHGVLSYHSNCGRGYHPSIFSSITAVRSWVEKTVGNRFERKSTFNVRR